RPGAHARNCGGDRRAPGVGRSRAAARARRPRHLRARRRTDGRRAGAPDRVAFSGMTAAGFPGIHLPGSMPFANGTQMFAFVGEHVKPWVRRAPDETGARTGWVGTQRVAFEIDAFETSPPEQVGPLPPLPRKQLRSDVDPDTFEFDAFQYEHAVGPS